MIQNITGVVFIIFHIICCVLVWTGINSHLLKVKRYLILPVIFVPVWGMICVLLLHFQIFFHQDKKREIGIEKMKINEEIYRSIIAPKEESDRNIVPLEEVLLIDEAAMRRDLIMNVLNDDPENYIDMLKQARMNDDVEVVHYAITGMVELSKEYEIIDIWHIGIGCLIAWVIWFVMFILLLMDRHKRTGEMLIR